MTTNKNRSNPIDTQSMSSMAHRALGAWRKRRRLFTVIFLLGSLGVIAGTYLKSPYYESKVLLLVKLDRQAISSTRSDVRYQVAQIMAEEAIASEVEILKTNELLNKLVDQLGIDVLADKKPRGKFMTWVLGLVDTSMNGITDMLASAGLISKTPPYNVTINKIRKGLSIYPIRKTQVIEVKFRSKNKDAVPLVLNKLIDLYQEKHAAINATSQRYGYYKQQAERQLEVLESTERALTKFKLRNDVVDLKSERAMLLQEMENLSSLLKGSNVSYRIVTDENSNNSDSASKQVDPTESVLAGNEVAMLTSQINTLQIERARRLTKNLPSHPSIRELDNQIVRTKSLMADEVKRVSKAITSYRTRLRTLRLIEPALNYLVRQLHIAEDAYDIYRKAMEDRRLAQEQETHVIIQVIDPALTPHQPMPPSRLKLITAGLILSLFIALIVILLVESFTSRRTSQPAYPASRDHEVQ